MSTKKRSAPENDVTDPTHFLKQYFEERGITHIIETDASTECIRRAEDARERFKLIPIHAPDSPLGDSQNASGPLTAAQKYSRRLLNNRKSAAAARVYHEVLKKEQAFTLSIVIGERDRMAVELKKAKSECEILLRELHQIRAAMKHLPNDVLVLHPPSCTGTPSDAQGHMQSDPVSPQFPRGDDQDHGYYFQFAVGTQRGELSNTDFEHDKPESRRD